MFCYHPHTLQALDRADDCRSGPTEKEIEALALNGGMKSPNDRDTLIPELMAKIVRCKNQLSGASDRTKKSQLLGLNEFEIAEHCNYGWCEVG